MPMKINALEPVEFGEISEVPTLTAEVRLRLDNLKFKSESDIDNAREVLASAFPEHKAEILAYLRSPIVPVFELVRLQAYLLGGENAVNAYDSSYASALDKLTSEALKRG